MLTPKVVPFAVLYVNEWYLYRGCSGQVTLVNFWLPSFSYSPHFIHLLVNPANSVFKIYQESHQILLLPLFRLVLPHYHLSLSPNSLLFLPFILSCVCVCVCGGGGMSSMALTFCWIQICFVECPMVLWIVFLFPHSSIQTVTLRKNIARLVVPLFNVTSKGT